MQAAAYVVGASGNPGAALMVLARGLGFDPVLPFGGVEQAEQQASLTPVCFFLFATVPDVEALRTVAEAIRFCPSRRVRFSPLIYFSESPQVQTIARCINMGFDDVITMPCTNAQVAERVGRQVGHSLTYYETPGYFGPDRRDRVTAPTRQGESRIGGQFRRIEIVRNVLSGVQVVRDDSYLAG